MLLVWSQCDLIDSALTFSGFCNRYRPKAKRFASPFDQYVCMSLYRKAGSGQYRLTAKSGRRLYDIMYPLRSRPKDIAKCIKRVIPCRCQARVSTTT